LLKVGHPVIRKSDDRKKGGGRVPGEGKRSRPGKGVISEGEEVPFVPKKAS